MLRGTYRGGAAGRFAALRAARLALAIAGAGLMLAGCTTSGEPVLGAIGGTGSRTVAFESIDGPPEQLFRKLVTQLGEEATAHRVAMVSREQPAQYRIRGYVAAHVQGKKTTITWYGTSSIPSASARCGSAARCRARHPSAPGRPPMMRWWPRIARDGMSRLAAFLASPGSPGEFLRRGGGVVCRIDD